jgi:hypothetical protein
MLIQSILKDQECLKSPFGKGGFRGFQAVKKSPLTPVLSGSQHWDLKEKAPKRPIGAIILLPKKPSIERS